MSDLIDNNENNSNFNYNQNFNQMGMELPNANAPLVLGIISIATCWLYGVPGLVCGIIAIVLHKKNKAVYVTNPGLYQNSYKNSNAGNVCAIIGVSLSSLWFIIALIGVIAGVAGSTRGFGRF